MADILLDTNILIGFLRGPKPAARFLSERESADRLLCSVVTAFERHEGCRDANERARLDRFPLSYTLVPIEQDDSLIALD